MPDREPEWAELMRAANRGDAEAYRRVLEGLAPVVRGLAGRSLARYGLSAGEAEDIVQETLLAVHLKRQTWDEDRPLLPWVRAIAENKVIDNLRRRGGRTHIPLDVLCDLGEEPAAGDPAAALTLDAERMMAHLKGRPRDIVVAISIQGASAREVAGRFGMTEGAVRVALHRALKSLAAAFRDDSR